jgi:hypothetical protein
MREFIIADNQDITKAGMMFLLGRQKAMGNRETSGEGIFFAEFIGLFLTMLG